jgi:hypothetical protein
MKILLICLIGVLLTGCAADKSAVIDLTVMSSTMASAAYDDIVYINPENYLGRTIKVQGNYTAAFWDVTGRYHHYITTKEEGGCCPGSFEFILSGDGGYPREGRRVELTGVFSRYTEHGRTTYYLAADEAAEVRPLPPVQP